MADPLEDTVKKLQGELETLCFELSTGNLSAEQAARLEQILLEYPELQDVYCRLVTMDNLLRTEFGEDGHAYPSVLYDLPSTYGSQTLLECPDDETCRSPAKKAVAPSSRRRWPVVVVAASLAAMIMLVGSQTIEYWYTQSGPKAKPNFGYEPSIPGKYVVLRSTRAIDMLHRVTNVAWQGNMVPFRTPLDEELEEEISDRLFQGTALLSPFNSLEAGGFVVVLPPGALLELSVSSDSIGENALAVMELDPQGRPTGVLVSFSNQMAARTAENSRLYGQLGTWAERNDSDIDKYYLLVGMQRMDKMHQKKTANTTSDWFVADCAVMVERPDLLHIGWDDSGWTAQLEGEARIDKDFNDLAATIRIRRENASSEAKLAEVRTSPELDPEPSTILESDAVESGYPFTVAPGQGVILIVSDDARLPNSLAVVNRQTGRVWWQRGNTPLDKPHFSAYVIENQSPEPLELALVGRHQTDTSIDRGKWHLSTHSVLVDGDRCQTVGFEDIGVDRDWNDLRVNFYWISD